MDKCPVESHSPTLSHTCHLLTMMMSLRTTKGVVFERLIQGEFN